MQISSAPGVSPAVLTNILNATLPYFGQVATHSFTPDVMNSTNKQQNSRTYHVMQSSVSQLQLKFVNWYASESAPGGAATITASIEYPVGTLTQVTFSGSPTGNIANGGAVVSDLVSIAIPQGASFYVRSFYQNAAGIVFKGSTNSTQEGLGEGFSAAVSGLPDLTMNPVFSFVSNGNIYGPAAIIGLTNKPSVLVIGDSRSSGSGDTLAPVAGSTEYGIIGPSLFPNIAFINSSRPGDALSQWTTTHAQRALLATYCTHVINELAINDFTAGESAAQVLSYHQATAALFPQCRYFLTTIPPKSSSTDNWATLANQTPDATSNGPRITFNNTLRTALPSWAAGYFEVADTLESARNSGIWKVGLVYTVDGSGVHPGSAGYQAVKAAGVINPAALVRYP